MRCVAIVMLVLAASGCSAPGANPREAGSTGAPAAAAFDGADYRDQAAKVAHGKRVTVEWGFGHEAQPLTAAERRDVVAYVRALARSRQP